MTSDRTHMQGGLKVDQIWKGLLIFALAAGAVLRIVGRSSTSLWEDEIIAVTHAVQPIMQLMANVILHEIHPPLYFLELHLWSYFSQSDDWFIANSIVFSFLALMSMLVVIRRLADASTALTATAIFAVLPAAVWMSEEVRMYAFLSVLLIWMLYFTTEAFSRTKSSYGSHILTGVLGASITCTHAIGWMAVFFYALYGASLLWARRAPLRDWLAWSLTFGVVALSAIPIILADMMHHADMAPLSGISDVFMWMGSGVTGEGYRYVPWLPYAGAATYLMVVVIGSFIARTRGMTLCFLVLPLVLCIAIAIGARPVFKTNFFSNFFSPFLALIIAELLMAIPRKKIFRPIILACVIVTLLTMAVSNRLALNAENGYYRRIADVINAEKQPGDLIWAPQMSIFWGAAWYLVGPNWGSPLAISAPFRPQSGWWRVFEWLGPDRVQQLRLIPTGQVINMRDGTPIVTGIENVDRIAVAKRVWLITYAPRDDIPVGIPGNSIGPLQRMKSLSFSALQLTLYAPSGLSYWKEKDWKPYE